MDAARGMGHRHVQQRHQRTAVGHVKRVVVLRPRRVAQLGLPRLHAVQGKAEVADEGDFHTKFQHDTLQEAKKQSAQDTARHTTAPDALRHHSGLPKGAPDCAAAQCQRLSPG